MKILAQFIALLAVFLLPRHALGYALSCPRMTHDESIERYIGLTSVLNSPTSENQVRGDVFNRLGYAPGDPVDMSLRLEILHEFIKLIETEIVLANLQSTVDTLYFVFDKKESKNSLLALETKKIASKATLHICPGVCQTIPRKELKKKAQVMVDKLVNSNTPRFSIEEIKEQLLTNFQGLNSILDFRNDEGNIDLAAYQQHYHVLKTSFPGFLLNTNKLRNHFKSMFTLDNYRLKGRVFTNPRHKTKIRRWKVKLALKEHFANLRMKWSNFTHKSLFKFKWYDRINLNAALDSMSGVSKLEEPTSYVERLLLLSKYMASSPLAIANVLNAKPEFYQDLCWMIENMDKATSSWYITASVSGLDSYLMPLSIGLLIFAGPFVPGVWLAGLIVLNIVTAIDLAKRSGDNIKLEREIRLHKRVEGTELESYHTKQIIESKEAVVRKQKWMTGLILAMEVGSLGAARGFSLYAKKVAKGLSESEKVSRLMKPFSLHSRSLRGRKNFRGMFARLETNSFISKVISKNRHAYEKASVDFHNKYLTYDYDLFRLSFAIKHGKKNDVMKLLLSSKTTGFGLNGFNIELGAEAIEQIIIHLNTPAMTDFTSVDILIRAVTGNY